MIDRFLAIDIGNTTTECGVFENDRLVKSWRLSSETVRTPDECWQTTAFFLNQFQIKPQSVAKSAIASVVPELQHNFGQMVKRYLNHDPLFISVETCPFLKVDYKNPHQVGADRLCNSFGGFFHYGGPSIVVDFGTAITFDVTSKEGFYLGGVIMAGPRTISTSLHKRTAQLPKVKLEFPDSVIGKTTGHAIQSGLSWGVTDMVDGMIERIRKELGAETKVVATGGLAEQYAQRSRYFSKVHPDLVLEGIRLICLKAEECDR